jgi:hypothetical protein
MSATKQTKKTKKPGKKTRQPVYPDAVYEECDDGGEHEPDGMSFAKADGTEFVVDVWCKKCGQSGAVAIDPKDIDW